MARKAIRTWIRENREELDRLIRGVCPNVGSLNDDDRRQWVLNDEGLYQWARRDGANV